MTIAQRLACFAVTAPGLEPLCAGELAHLGIRGRVEDGGVAWTAANPIESIARANLWLRTATRVIVRVAEFRATAFYELERHAKRIDWQRWLVPGAPVRFRVTSRKSKLYHSDAIAQRFTEAVDRRVPGARVERAEATDDDTPSGDQLFIVRFAHDVCTLSADTSGGLLHLRGYRQQLAKAPLRETLAAAILLGAGWDGTTPLTDPLCGSGTIPIEGALIARRMAPGRARGFAFTRWPSVDESSWKPVLEDARAGELERSAVEISGSDRDAGAIGAARANAERAGVADDVRLTVASISALPFAEPPGLVAGNPPYGIRIGETDRLRDLYAQVGNVLRRTRVGWTLALLTADRDGSLVRQTGLRFEERFRTRNGGIPVKLGVGEIPGSGRPNPSRIRRIE